MRRQYVKIPFSVLADMIREHKNPLKYTRIKSGIPLDARLIETGTFIPDGYGGTEAGVFLTFEHESFPEIKEGVVSPPFNIEVQTIVTMEEL